MIKSGVPIQIPWYKPTLFGNESTYLSRAIESTWISGGPYVDEFERRFVDLIGAHHGLTTSNGTTALQLAVKALEIGSGSEVIVPGFTFVSPYNAVVESGARPIFAEIDEKTWCLDPESTRRLITKKTKAIIAVHLFGNVCEMDELREIASSHKIKLIEDTAESAFSTYNNQCAGTFGDVGCFSFQATKTITMGEGGFVTSASSDLIEKMRVIRSHGMSPTRRYWHDCVGFNYRLTNIQAALGCAQLDNLNDILSARSKMFENYRRNLHGEPGFRFQTFMKGISPVIWAVAVYLEPEFFSISRDEIMTQLAQAGIETRPGFYPASVLPPYKGASLPVCERVAANMILLPSFPGLTDAEITEVCSILKQMRRKI